MTLLFGLFNLNALVLGAGMAVVARNEFKGRSAILRSEVTGPELLWRNQVVLMALIIMYCLWSIYRTTGQPDPQMAELTELLGSDLDEVVRSLTLMMYTGVIGTTVIFQGLNARYYLRRIGMIREYLSQTPSRVLKLQESVRDRGGSPTSVNPQHRSRNPPGVLRRKEQHRVRDVRRGAELVQRDPRDHLLLPFGTVGVPLLLGIRVRANEARRDAVDRDPERPELVGELSRESNLTRFGRRVYLDARQADTEPCTTRDIHDTPIPGFLPSSSKYCSTCIQVISAILMRSQPQCARSRTRAPFAGRQEPRDR